jgi:GT2 family glycosyltransferase
MPDGSVQASVIIVNYEGKDDLEECLPSVCDQSFDEYEVILVDNDSSDGSVEYVREEFPDVRVLANDENRWYPGGNNDGLAIARGEYLVILNPDVEVAHDWLEALLEPLEDDTVDPSVGLTTSRVVRFDDRTTLNTCGNLAHYTGLGFCRGLDEPVASYPERERVPAVSGSAFAMRRDVYEAIGGFDETFQMYFEDLDLSWRARLAGYEILYVPASIVYHKYDLTIPAWKLFNMERNRYLILLKHLRRSTLLRLLPGLLLTEMLVWVYAALNGVGALRQKAASWWWLWGNRDSIVEKRDETQVLRKRSDAALLAEMTAGLPLEQFGITGSVHRVLSPIVRAAYWPWHRLATWRDG